MTFNKGSLIQVDYTAKIKDNDEVFDTTNEETAKKHSIYESHITYRPKLVSIGEVSFSVLQGLDEALAQTSVGDKLTVEVTPDKGFGQRDSKKVRMIPIRKLGEDAEKVSVGDTIEVDNKKGIIRFIGSGRVQMDYNHRYAGKTILFDVHVIKSLDSPHDKIDGILKNRFDVEDAKIIFDLKDNDVDIAIPEEFFRAESLQITKYFIQQDVFKFVPTLNKLSFVETYLNKQTPETKSETKQTTPETTATTTSEQTTPETKSETKQTTPESKPETKQTTP